MSRRTNKLSVSVVGATGLVGRELLGILTDRAWPIGELRLFASRETVVSVRGETRRVEPCPEPFTVDADVVFLTATSELARRLVPGLRENGSVVVDNSSAFRMAPDVPLVVPEINGAAVGSGLIANPNCSTIILLLALAPLHRQFGCRHANVCTYQAVSGAGGQAVDDLFAQTGEYLKRRVVDDSPAHGRGSDTPMAFNVWSHESPVEPDTGVNGEERKMLNETARILTERVPMSVTCVRVPVERAHCLAVSVLFERPVSEADFRSVLESAPGIEVVDDAARGLSPTARDASGRDEVLVGRIRIDESGATGETSAGRPTSDRYQFWIAGDQLRKGAALNAVQIAEGAPRLADYFAREVSS